MNNYGKNWLRLLAALIIGGLIAAAVVSLSLIVNGCDMTEPVPKLTPAQTKCVGRTPVECVEAWLRGDEQEEVLQVFCRSENVDLCYEHASVTLAQN